MSQRQLLLAIVVLALGLAFLVRRLQNQIVDALHSVAPYGAAATATEAPFHLPAEPAADGSALPRDAAQEGDEPVDWEPRMTGGRADVGSPVIPAKYAPTYDAFYALLRDQYPNADLAAAYARIEAIWPEYQQLRRARAQWVEYAREYETTYDPDGNEEQSSKVKPFPGTKRIEELEAFMKGAMR